MILAAIQLLAGFTRYARTVAAPAIDLTLFNLRSFRIGTLVGGLCRVGFNGVPAADAAGRLGHEPVASGSLTFVSALSALAVRPVLVFVLRMYGFKRVLMGSATPERFHMVFLMMAVIPLLTLPGFMFLRREDGVQVSGHVRRWKK